jgi:hypothetical protein
MTRPHPADQPCRVSPAASSGLPPVMGGPGGEDGNKDKTKPIRVLLPDLPSSESIRGDRRT